MGRMPLRNELGDFRWQQPLLLGVPGPESLGHTYLSYRPCEALPLICRFLSFFIEGGTPAPEPKASFTLTAVANATDRERTGRRVGTRTLNLDTLLEGAKALREERAGILEFDAGMPREAAEHLVGIVAETQMGAA